VPSETPYWLTVPERGLFTGIAILGAIGSGKTSCAMYPFASKFWPIAPVTKKNGSAG